MSAGRKKLVHDPPSASSFQKILQGFRVCDFVHHIYSNKIYSIYEFVCLLYICKQLPPPEKHARVSRFIVRQNARKIPCWPLLPQRP